MADRAVEIRYKSHKFRRGELADIVKELPRRLRAPVMKFAAEEYMRKFRLYPHYRFKGRPRAYGKVSDAPAGYFSWKQFRYVMWKIHQPGFNLGQSNRNMDIKNAWHIEGRGVNVEIVNSAPGAVYLFDPKQQARQPALVGWNTVDVMYTEAENYVTERVWTEVIKLADDLLENIMTGRR